MSFPQIDLKRLRYIAVLARSGSYTAAAAELGLTQSALTRSIQTMEEHFAVKLFDRGRAGLQPTAVGRELLRRSQELLSEAEDLGRFLNRAGKGEAGEVHFGLGPMLATFFLPSIVTEHLSEASEVRFYATVRGATELIELLARDRIEFYIAADAPRPSEPEVTVTPIGEAAVSLVVRRDHPILKLDRPDFSEIARYPLISSHHTADFYSQDGAQGQLPPLQFQIDDTNVLYTVARNTDAILMTTAPVSARTIADTELVVMDWPLADRPARMKVVAVTRARRTLSPAALEILGRFETWLAQT